MQSLIMFTLFESHSGLLPIFRSC